MPSSSAADVVGNIMVGTLEVPTHASAAEDEVLSIMVDAAAASSARQRRAAAVLTKTALVGRCRLTLG